MTSLALQLRSRTPQPMPIMTFADIAGGLRLRDAALLGLATDGLPVILHFGNPRPGPIVVTGKPGSGKTNLLRCLARSAAMYCSEVGIHVITDRPEAWIGLPVAVTDDRYLEDMANSVFGKELYPRWLLLVDQLELVHNWSALNHLCQWGPPRGLWPVIAAQSPNDLPVNAWPFRTRMAGAGRSNEFTYRNLRGDQVRFFTLT